MNTTRRIALSLLMIALVASCSALDEPGSVPANESTTVDAGDGLFPDVIGVEVSKNDDGSFDFEVTISSPYDTPDRYADAWRVKAEDGTVFGVRELLHDHANEQPFTRTLSGVEIPGEVGTVVVEGRDQRNGWGGNSQQVDLP